MKKRVSAAVGIARGVGRAVGVASVILEGEAMGRRERLEQADANQKKAQKLGGENKARQKAAEREARNIAMAREFEKKRERSGRSPSGLMAEIGKPRGLKRSQAIDVIKATRKKLLGA